MKTKIFILSSLILLAIQISAEIIEVENLVSCNEISQPEESYSLPTLKLNNSDTRIQSIRPILDTLTANKSVELYDWVVISDEDVTCFSFGSDAFGLLGRPAFLGKCKGLYKHQYKDFSKCFAIYDKSDNSQFYSSCFVNTTDSTTIMFKNRRLPQNVFIAVEDIMTFVKCAFYNDSMYVEDFKYNYVL